MSCRNENFSCSSVDESLEGFVIDFISNDFHIFRLTTITRISVAQRCCCWAARWHSSIHLTHLLWWWHVCFYEPEAMWTYQTCARKNCLKTFSFRSIKISFMLTWRALGAEKNSFWFMCWMCITLMMSLPLPLAQSTLQLTAYFGDILYK